MRRLHRAIDRLSDAALALAATIAVYVILHILVEVAARNLFGASTFVLDEFVGYSVAAATCLSAGAAFRHGDFIRITFLADLLARRPRARAALEALCTAATLALTALLAWNFVAATLAHHRRGITSDTIAQTPLWIPEALASLGLVVLALQVASHLAGSVAALFGAPADPGDHAADPGAAI